MESARQRALRALTDFLHLEAAGGFVLMGASVLAMLVANSPWAEAYANALQVKLALTLDGHGINKPLLLWINDGLMAVFFILVGLELKREMVLGHLSSLGRASLPAFAALGGMAIPAAIYAALNWGDAAAMKGWAIPSATDIAFALGVLSLLGPRVPTALKAFLLSVAIFDDLGAIVIIAFFYTSSLSLGAMIWAGVFLAGLVVLNRAGVTRIAAYVLLGIPLWVAVLKSGVHATLAGVVLAMAVPLRSGRAPSQDETAHSPAQQLEHALHPWVAFGVLPIFAFANAGVPLAGLSLRDMSHPVPLGIVLGLFFGKQIGIFLFSWLAVRSRLAALGEGVSWRQLYGVSLLCGIGFTMSFFIASLAFEQGGEAYFGLERLGILSGSLLAGVGGYFALRAALRPTP
jgi:NhaA family Na+:H+ antiporter